MLASVLLFSGAGRCIPAPRAEGIAGEGAAALAATADTALPAVLAAPSAPAEQNDDVLTDTVELAKEHFTKKMPDLKFGNKNQ